MSAKKSKAILERRTFKTSRLLDFSSEKELTAQIGHGREAWPLVAVKELVDNAIDACEESSTAPEVVVKVDEDGICVSDNGPGIPPKTVTEMLDFNVRVSSREAYVSPTRGAQGNALKTLVAMPHVLDGKQGCVTIEARGCRHVITMKVDPIQQTPVIDHQQHDGRSLKNGTVVKIHWPNSLSPQLRDSEGEIIQLAEDFTFLNPHLTLTIDWFGTQRTIAATDVEWSKWRPNDPTSSHWYDPERFERLVAGYITDDADQGTDRKARELIAEFDGLSGTARQKIVLAQTGLARMNLSMLRNGDGLDREKVAQLLRAMQANSKEVKPQALGIIGQEHFRTRFSNLGCELKTFQYRKVTYVADGLPFVWEVAFAWQPGTNKRRLITGVNWSPSWINPFRELGASGESLDSILEQIRAGQSEPVVMLIHMVCPRVTYTDRGKTAVVLT